VSQARKDPMGGLSKTTRRHMPDGSSLHNDCPENRIYPSPVYVARGAV
jgi:hypothetical protein